MQPQKFHFGWRFAPDPAGKLTAFPQTFPQRLGGYKGPTSVGHLALHRTTGTADTVDFSDVGSRTVCQPYLS